MKLNKLLTVVLAVLFVVAAAIPVSALNETWNGATMYSGGRVKGYAHVNGTAIGMSTSVSFLANVPHLPSSDYICKTAVMYIAGGVTYFDGSSAAPMLSMNTVYSHNGTVTGAYFDFIVNDSSVLHCTIGTFS